MKGRGGLGAGKRGREGKEEMRRGKGELGE